MTKRVWYDRYEYNHTTFKLNAEQKSVIYDIISTSDVWKNFYGELPSRPERSKGMKALFGDLSFENGVLEDDRDNVLFLYWFSDLELDPKIKNIFIV